MDPLINIPAICTKIRVVLDKGHYLHNLFNADPGLPGSLLAISGLLSGVETLIDPRVMVQNSDVLGSLLGANDEGNGIESLTMISLGVVVYAANEALNNMLNQLEIGQMGSDTKSNVSSLVVSYFKVMFRLSDLHDELKIFEESSTCRGLSLACVSSQGIEGGDVLNKMIENSMNAQRGKALKRQLNIDTYGICTVSTIPATAKAIYDDTEVEKHFELRVWVDASSSFDGRKAETEQKLADVVSNVMSYHAMAIASHFPPVYSEKLKLWLETKDMKELQLEIIREYQGIIKNEVSEKKFLLVLSDVSEDHMSQWEDLFAPLRHGSSGSIVVITSRSLHVLEALKNIDIRDVEAIQHGLFWNFFSSFAFGDQEPKDYPSLHDTGKRLQEILSLGESLRLEGTYKPKKAWGVCHLSVRTDNLSILSNITGLYNLRTFITFGPYEPETSDSLMPLLMKQQQLVILDLTGCGMTNFPELFAPLKHLRYLNLSDSGIETLHNNFTKLTSLQVLNLQGCQLESLPRDTNMLTNLRHIIAPSWLISKVSCIGKLNNLQELEEFVVANEEGHEIWQLGGMNQLGGSLSISRIENVTDKDESCKARLSDKKRVISLKLEWCASNEIHNRSGRVLEGLEPPPTIEELEIIGFDGVNLPTWLGTNWLCNISEIRLNDCKNLWEILVLGQLQKLRILKLEGLTSVRNVSFGQNHHAHLGNVGFPLLTELCFEDMPQWQEWKEDKDSFPNLRRLVLKNCPNLKRLPSMYYSRLQEMHVEEVGLNLLLPKIKQRGMSLLSYIKVVGCQSLCSFGKAFHANKSLTVLILENCSKLSTFEESKDAHSLPSSLKCLEITGCAFDDDPLSKALVNLSSLSVLKIARCQKIRLFPHLGTLSSLERLSVEDNNALEYLNGLETLSSLKELCIRECPQLIIDYSTIGTSKSGLSSLENLCTNALSIFMGPITSSLLSLRVLTIEENLENEDLNRFVMNGPFVKCLEQLSLVNCNGVTLLPRNMKKLLCLKRLYLERCPGLGSLPELPSRLEELYVIQCPLLEEPCQEDGADWYKISHVQCKYFDWE